QGAGRPGRGARRGKFRARGEPAEVAAQGVERPADRLEPRVEERDRVGAGRIQMPVAALLEAVEAQPLEAAQLGVVDAQGRTATRTRVAVLHDEADAAERNLDHGARVYRASGRRPRDVSAAGAPRGARARPGGSE